MGKKITKDTVVVPKEEYRFLKELYRTVKRQSFLLRINEAEENLRAGKVKKVSVDKFIQEENENGLEKSYCKHTRCAKG